MENKYYILNFTLTVTFHSARAWITKTWSVGVRTLCTLTYFAAVEAIITTRTWLITSVIYNLMLFYVRACKSTYILQVKYFTIIPYISIWHLYPRFNIATLQDIQTSSIDVFTCHLYIQVCMWIRQILKEKAQHTHFPVYNN